MEELQKTYWTERYCLIPDVADQLQLKGAEHGIYVHEQWVSFKSKSAKRKQQSMEKPEAFSASCSASTAVKAFRSTGARYGLFFGHLLEGKYITDHGDYHATVLILENDKAQKKAYIFNPYQKDRSCSLAPVACTLVHTWSSTVKYVKLIRGIQRKGYTTCVIHAAEFGKKFVSDPTAVLEEVNKQQKEDLEESNKDKKRKKSTELIIKYKKT